MAGDEKWVRWNTHHSTQVDVELFGNTLHLAQNPNTNHLGTTVWDSSIVLAKFLEKNAKKGDFARHRLKGKRAIELEVISLLQRNYENNLSPAALRGQEMSNSAGHVAVQELDWSNLEHYAPVNPPFDYVLAADCVYHEQIVENFLRTVLAMTHSKSTVVVVNELRSEAVHSRFTSLFEQYFTIKRTPRSKMDALLKSSKMGLEAPSRQIVSQPFKLYDWLLEGFDELVRRAQPGRQCGRLLPAFPLELLSYFVRTVRQGRIALAGQWSISTLAVFNESETELLNEGSEWLDHPDVQAAILVKAHIPAIVLAAVFKLDMWDIQRAMQTIYKATRKKAEAAAAAKAAPPPAKGSLECIADRVKQRRHTC
ncbi:hypothetical protein WJX82_005622 [Trebouxia sp. C0006]